MVKNNTQLVFMEKDIGQYITVEIRTRILYAITAWVVVAYCFLPFLTVVSLTSLLVSFHAFMRDPKHIEANSHYTDDNGSGDEADSCDSGVVIETSDAV